MTLDEFFDALHGFNAAAPGVFQIDSAGRLRMPEKEVCRVFDIPEQLHPGPADPITAVCAFLTCEFHGLGSNTAAKQLKLSQKNSLLLQEATESPLQIQVEYYWRRIMGRRRVKRTVRKRELIADKEMLDELRADLMSAVGVSTELVVRENMLPAITEG